MSHGRRHRRSIQNHTDRDLLTVAAIASRVGGCTCDDPWLTLVHRAPPHRVRVAHDADCDLWLARSTPTRGDPDG